MDELASRALAQTAALVSLLRFTSLAHKALHSQLLRLHKATAKLTYVATALLATVVEQGFCTAPETGDQEEGQLDQKGSLKEGTVCTLCSALLMIGRLMHAHITCLPGLDAQGQIRLSMQAPKGEDGGRSAHWFVIQAMC